MRKPFLLMCFLMLSGALLQAFEIKEVQVGPSLRFLKWNTAKGPVRIVLHPAGSDNLPITAAEAALQSAMNSWQNVPSQSLRFQYAGRNSAAASNSSDTLNSVFWVEKNWPYSSTVMAVTRFSFFLTDPPELADADILMNGQSFKWSTSPVTNANPQRVLTHELGHLMGLSHSSVAGSIMYPSYSSGPPGLLSVDERAAIQFLYGTPILDFRLITPVANAAYTERMVEKGLPLPVFRWGNAGPVSYDVEFSDTTAFKKKVKFTAGPKTSFLPNAAQEQQLLNLSAQKVVFWRVNTGASQTPPRTLRFRPFSSPTAQSAALSSEIDLDGENTDLRLIVFAIVSLLLILSAIFVFRHVRATNP